MNKKSSKVIAQVFALVMLVTVLSSCNRGSGCPNNEFDSQPIIVLPFLK